jgi:hypothetical protein
MDVYGSIWFMEAISLFPAPDILPSAASDENVAVRNWLDA